VTGNFAKYTRTIKLSPALGDWTTLNPPSMSESPFRVRQVHSTGFDSLPKDILQSAHYIHYRLGELMCQKLSKDMDIKVELHSVSASQLMYDHFIKSVSEQVIQADLMSPSGDRINVLIDWPLAEQIINRLTGGAGEAVGSYEFSTIEAGILETQMEELVTLLPSAWQKAWNFDHLSFDFHAGAYQVNRKVSPREAYIVFEYELLIGFGDIHRISWAYPNALIRAMLSNYAQATHSIQQSLSLSDATLNRHKISAKVILGETTIAMSDLRTLSKGDIIRLDSNIESPLSLVLGDSTVLTVQPGTQNNRLCAQVILWDDRPSSSDSRPTLTPASTQAAPFVALPTLVEAPVIPPPAASLIPAEIRHDDDEDNYASHFDFDDDILMDDSADTIVETPGIEESIPDPIAEADSEDEFSFDDNFESDDVFSGDYDLDSTHETDIATSDTESDDEFSWDDLEDEA